MGKDKILSSLKKALDDKSSIKIQYKSIKGKHSSRSIQPKEILDFCPICGQNASVYYTEINDIKLAYK